MNDFILYILNFVKSLFSEIKEDKSIIIKKEYIIKTSLINYNTTINSKVYGTSGYLAGTKTDANNYKNLFDRLLISTKVLGNEFSTTKNILDWIKVIYNTYKDKVGKKLLILVFSKHGTQIQNKNDNDKDKKSEGLLNWDSVLLDDVFILFLNTLFDATWDILIICDTCYSGGMYNVSINSKGVKKSLNVNKEHIVYSLTPVIASKEKPNIKWLLASKENEEAIDLGVEKGGAFSYELFKHFNTNISYSKCMTLINKGLTTQTASIKNSKSSSFNDNELMF